MPPRRRPSSPVQEQESETLHNVAASTQRTPDEERVGETPVNAQGMSRDELDEYISIDRENLRLKRKREYVEARQRGEIPAIDPFEFDDPVGPTPERPEQRPRREGGIRIQLPPLRFRGGNYAETQNFIFDLENRFRMYADDFPTDSQRVVYTASSLIGPLKTRWRNYVMLSHQNDPDDVTWTQAKRWLTERITDDATRSLDAVTKLRRTSQRGDQSFDQFLDIYEATESELSFEYPALARVCHLISALTPDMRKQIVSSGIPADYLALLTAARRAESLLRGGQPTPGRAPPASQRPTFYPPAAPAAPATSPVPAATPAPVAQHPVPRNNANVDQSGGPQRGSCYGCGDPGHFSDRCPHTICRNCGKKGHAASRCPTPLTNPNTLPVARHVAPDP